VAIADNGEDSFARGKELVQVMRRDLAVSKLLGRKVEHRDVWPPNVLNSNQKYMPRD
jgi:hypothetical protein